MITQIGNNSVYNPMRGIIKGYFGIDKVSDSVYIPVWNSINDDVEKCLNECMNESIWKSVLQSIDKKNVEK